MPDQVGADQPPQGQPGAEVNGDSPSIRSRYRAGAGVNRNQKIGFCSGTLILLALSIGLLIDQVRYVDAYYGESKVVSDETVAWVLGVTLFVSIIIWFITWQIIDADNQRSAKAKKALAQIQETSATDFQSLWKDNRKRLNIYHDLVTAYAQSTRFATIAMITIGFLFIVVMSIIAALAKETSGAIASSVIGASGALLTGFIANAVLKNAASSQSELLSFFSHPLAVERALSAERIIKEIQDPTEKAASQRILISYLTGPQLSKSSDDQNPGT